MPVFGGGGGLKFQIDALRAEKDGLQREIETLQSEKRDLKREIEALNSEKETHRVDVEGSNGAEAFYEEKTFEEDSDKVVNFTGLPSYSVLKSLLSY